MEAPLLSSTSQYPATDRPLSYLLRWVVIATTALLLALACLLLVRRSLGELRQPLPDFTLLGVGALLAAMVSLLRLGWSRDRAGRGARILLLLASSVALALLAYSLSLPGSSPWALILFWSIIVGQEIPWWFVALGGRRFVPSKQSDVREGAALSGHDPLSLMTATDLESDLPPDVSQQITRAWEDGQEVYFGRLRCQFASSARTQSLHVGFCPPLLSVPDLSIHQIDGPAARIKVTQVERFGARLDVRLSKIAREKTDVVIEFYARTAKEEEKTES